MRVWGGGDFGEYKDRQKISDRISVYFPRPPTPHTHILCYRTLDESFDGTAAPVDGAMLGVVGVALTLAVVLSPPAPKLTSLLKGTTNLDALLRLHAKHGDAFNEIHCAATWTTLQKHQRSSAARIWLGDDITALRQQTIDMARRDELGGRAIATIASAAVRSGARAKDASAAPLFSALAEAALERTGEMNAQALSNTAWAFAKAGNASPALFDALAKRAVVRLHQFNPQNLANTAWAYATAGITSDVLFEAIAEECAARPKHLGEFDEQHISNLYGRMQPPSMPRRRSAPSPRGARAEFEAQELSITAWASRRPGMNAGALRSDRRGARPRLREFTQQGLVNLAWASATAGRSDAKGLLDALAAVATPKVASFTAQNVANLAAPYALLGLAPPSLFAALAETATPRLSDFSPPALTALACAFARAKHEAPALWDGLEAAVEARAFEFPPRCLAEVSWAFTTAGRPSQPVFDALAAAAAARVTEFEPKELATMGWAFARASFAVPRVWKLGWQEAAVAPDGPGVGLSDGGALGGSSGSDSSSGMRGGGGWNPSD